MTYLKNTSPLLTFHTQKLCHHNSISQITTFKSKPKTVLLAYRVGSLAAHQN